MGLEHCAMVVSKKRQESSSLAAEFIRKVHLRDYLEYLIPLKLKRYLIKKENMKVLTSVSLREITLIDYCTARQCSPLRRDFMKCSIIDPALSLLMKHLVIGQRQKAPNFLALHWSPHGGLVPLVSIS